MKVWEAIVEIVKSFNSRGHPAYALAALAMTLTAFVVLAAFVSGTAPVLATKAGGFIGRANGNEVGPPIDNGPSLVRR
jgi:hypothetical protein